MNTGDFFDMGEENSFTHKTSHDDFGKLVEKALAKHLKNVGRNDHNLLSPELSIVKR